jgi:hypothetical protein
VTNLKIGNIKKKTTGMRVDRVEHKVKCDVLFHCLGAGFGKLLCKFIKKVFFAMWSSLLSAH